MNTGILQPKASNQFVVKFYENSGVIGPDAKEIEELKIVGQQLVRFGSFNFSPFVQHPLPEVRITVEDDSRGKTFDIIHYYNLTKRPFLMCLQFLDPNGGLADSFWFHGSTFANFSYDVVSYYGTNKTISVTESKIRPNREIDTGNELMDILLKFAGDLKIQHTENAAIETVKPEVGVIYISVERMSAPRNQK